LLYNQHADFELGSDSNSNSTSPWAIACEPATHPSRAASPLRERFARGPRNVSRAHSKAPTTRRAGKEIVPGYNSDSNPLSGFYSDSSYEFDFGSDLDEPESKNNTTEQPLSGPAASLVITSTPVGRFVYWPDRKPADLTVGTHVASPTSTHFPSRREHRLLQLGSTLRQRWQPTNPALALPNGKSS
jgi:hypothetical protein